jgi:protein SCO1
MPPLGGAGHRPWGAVIERAGPQALGCTMSARGHLVSAVLALAIWGLVALSCGPAQAVGWGADYFPNVQLITHNGKTVRLYDDLLKGKKVAVAVMYTSCSVECPLITVRMVELRKALGDHVGKDIYFYSISIDPWDRPDVLKEYAAKFGAGGPGWEFLTGKEEDIRLVTKKLGLSRTSDKANLDGHTASLMVGNVDSGQWMRNSAVDNPQFLAASMLSFLGLTKGDIGPSYAQVKPIAIDPGKYLFESRCEGCHTLGKGDKIGPDLAGLSARRGRSWVARYISDPQAMRDSRDAVALDLMPRYKIRMPPQGLDQEQLGHVLKYLESQAASAASPSAPAALGGLAR